MAKIGFGNYYDLFGKSMSYFKYKYLTINYIGNGIIG